MATFYDDFERANGSLGSNWTDAYSSSSIVSGAAVGTSGTFTVCNTITDSGRNEAQIHFVWITGQTYTACAGVKMSNAARAGYWAGVYNNGGTWTFAIWRRDASANTVIASEALGSYPVYSGLINIVYDTDTIYATLDGAHAISVADTTYVLNSYMGMWLTNSSAVALDFRAVGGAAVQLDITPDVVGNYGSTIPLTATGTGTAWTSGTPGSPTFSCNHGTITAQTVNGTTDADLTFDPGDYLGPVTFTDPSTGATDTITVTSDTEVVPPGGTFLSQTAIDYIERSAAAEETAYILNRTTDITVTSDETSAMFGMYQTKRSVTESTYEPSGNPAVTAIADILWRLVNGGYDPTAGPFPTPGFSTLDAGLVAIKADLDELMGESEWTLPDLLAYLGGDPFASHRDIMTAIAGVSEPDLTPVLDAIAALQGDPLATVKAVLDRVYLLDPTGTHNLAEILDAIAAIEGGEVDLSPVLTAISDLQTYIHGEHETIRTELAAGFLVVSAIQALIGSATGTVANVISGVTDVLAIVNEVKDAVTPIAVPPVWIDEAHATVGDAVALADALDISGPLDGLIVNITDSPSGAAKFGFGTTKSWRYVGAVIFQSDRGDWEWAQPIGLEGQIITPRTMQHAAAARFRVESGWQGTVRAFTVTAGA